jgi:hypothetical protein
MPDSIIVYRNPVEKMIWENPEYMMYAIGFAVGIVLLFLLANYAWMKFKQRKW